MERGLSRLLSLACRRARRAGNIAFFVNEIQELIVTLNRSGDQNLSLTFARLGLAAHVSMTINKIKELLVVPLQAQLFNFLCHAYLEARDHWLDASLSA